MNEIVIYQAEQLNQQIKVRVDGDTIWLTQAQIVSLFDSSKANISEHIKHIFQTGELVENSVVRKYRTTATDGKNYNAQYPKIEIKKITTAHDRFMIIDNNTVYHFGASLKDAGKKWFAFSKLTIDAKDILEKLNGKNNGE